MAEMYSVTAALGRVSLQSNCFLVTFIGVEVSLSLLRLLLLLIWFVYL